LPSVPCPASSAAIHWTLCRHADAARGDHQLAFLITVLGNAFAERQLAGALALALPGLARPRLHAQHVTRTQRAMIFEMLLGMQPAAAGRSLRHAARRLAGTEPRLTRTPAQRILRIELRDRL